MRTDVCYCCEHKWWRRRAVLSQQLNFTLLRGFCVCCVSLFVWCFKTTVYRILSAFHLTDVIGHIFFPVPSFIISSDRMPLKAIVKKTQKSQKKRKNLGQKWLSVENIRNVPSIIRQSEEMPIAWQRLCLRWSHYNYC